MKKILKKKLMKKLLIYLLIGVLGFLTAAVCLAVIATIVFFPAVLCGWLDNESYLYIYIGHGLVALTALGYKIMEDA
jgi:hypothetical protein